MEIERKFLIKKEQLPQNLDHYPHHQLEQAYIITNPVLRIRKKDDTYILTYKGQGLMTREEIEFPLTEEAYNQLLTKTEGNIITKTRYNLPDGNYTIELDIFSGTFEGLYLAEVEFPTEDAALSYQPPEWFGPDVSNENTFHNSTLSKMSAHNLQQIHNEISKRFE